MVLCFFSQSFWTEDLPKKLVCMLGRSRCVLLLEVMGHGEESNAAQDLLTSHLNRLPPFQMEEKLLRLEARKESSTLGLGVAVWIEGSPSYAQPNIPLRVQ